LSYFAQILFSGIGYGNGREGFPMNTRIHTTSVTCLFCRDLVSLENAKADELGRAVHENCYVERLLRLPSGYLNWFSC
jgi:hypothetical protein